MATSLPRFPLTSGGGSVSEEEADEMFPLTGRYVWRLLVVVLSFEVEKRLLKEKLGFLSVFWCEGVEFGGTVSFPNFTRAVAERCAMSTI